VDVYQSNSKLKIILKKEVLLAFCLCEFPSGSIHVSDERTMTHKYSNTGSFLRGSSGHIFEIHVAEIPTFLTHVFGRADAVLKRNGVDQKMGKVFE